MIIKSTPDQGLTMTRCRAKLSSAPPALAATGHRTVTSQHLVSATSPELSEVEFGLTIGFNAHARWMQRCTGAAGFADMVALDMPVLHHVTSQDLEKKLADQTCLMPGFAGTLDENTAFGDVAGPLRTLSGRHDQAVRAAAVSMFTPLDKESA